MRVWGRIHASPAEAGSGSAAAGRLIPRILIVEDDVLIRAAAAQYLRDVGFDVLEAVDVEQALQLLRAERVAVVFSDVKLPGGRSGFDLMTIVRKDYPEAKVLLTSGVVRADDMPLGDVTLLRKPYFLFDLERRLRTLIAEG